MVDFIYNVINSSRSLSTDRRHLYLGLEVRSRPPPPHDQPAAALCEQQCRPRQAPAAAPESTTPDPASGQGEDDVTYDQQAPPPVRAVVPPCPMTVPPLEESVPHHHPRTGGEEGLAAAQAERALPGDLCRWRRGGAKEGGGARSGRSGLPSAARGDGARRGEGWEEVWRRLEEVIGRRRFGGGWGGDLYSIILVTHAHV